MTHRQCRKCRTDKPIDAYGADARNGLDGLSRVCRECRRADGRRWYAQHRDEVKAATQTPEGKAKLAEKSLKQSERYHTDPVYREAKKAKERERGKSLRAKARRRERSQARHRHQQATNPLYRLKKSLRTRLSLAVAGATKAGKTLELIGCTPEELTNHLESLWQPGMSWETYGRYGWHVDHIIPCAAFDLTKPEEQRKCFHYSNLQPLWARDNCSKQNWVPDYQI